MDGLVDGWLTMLLHFILYGVRCKGTAEHHLSNVKSTPLTKTLRLHVRILDLLPAMFLFAISTKMAQKLMYIAATH